MKNKSLYIITLLLIAYPAYAGVWEYVAYTRANQALAEIDALKMRVRHLEEMLLNEALEGE